MYNEGIHIVTLCTLRLCMHCEGGCKLYCIYSNIHIVRLCVASLFILTISIVKVCTVKVCTVHIK
jgi:hypothetical protein